MPRYAVAVEPLVLRPGDSHPQPTVEVTGLGVDPAGAVAVFRLYRRATRQVALEVDAVAAPAGAAPTWSATLTADWLSSDTADLEPGEYFGQFSLSLAGGAQLTAPADTSMRVSLT